MGIVFLVERWHYQKLFLKHGGFGVIIYLLYPMYRLPPVKITYRERNM